MNIVARMVKTALIYQILWEVSPSGVRFDHYQII